MSIEHITAKLKEPPELKKPEKQCYYVACFRYSPGGQWFTSHNVWSTEQAAALQFPDGSVDKKIAVIDLPL